MAVARRRLGRLVIELTVAVLAFSGLVVGLCGLHVSRAEVDVEAADDEARQLLSRNNRTSPYLWMFSAISVAPAVLFWRNTLLLMVFCLVFVATYVTAYLMIVRFKVPRWLRP